MFKLGKYYIDYFYIVAITACAVLYWALPEKAHDILVAGVVVLGISVIDTIVNGKTKGEE